MAKTSGPSMSSQAYERMRADILTGVVAADQRIVISDVVRNLGLSLGAVREALSQLGSEGLVVLETNKGYRVAPITAEELEDLTRARLLIECECLANAIRNGDIRWEADIVATLFELSRHSLYDPQDGERMNPFWTDAHKRFHEALVAACDSPWLLRIRDMLFLQAERYRVATLPVDTEPRDLPAEHKAIADAAIARNIPVATEALRSHLQKTRRILLDAGIAQAGQARA